MAIVDERPIDEAPGEPSHGFCRKIASVRTQWMAAPFRDPSPLEANGLFTSRAQVSCALQTAICVLRVSDEWATSGSVACVASHIRG